MSKLCPAPFTKEEAEVGSHFAYKRFGFHPDPKTLREKAHTVLKEGGVGSPVKDLSRAILNNLRDVNFGERSAYLSAISKMLSERAEKKREEAYIAKRERPPIYGPAA